MSLIVFSGRQTHSRWRVGEFELGAFRLAQQLAVPLVPVSIVGSFQHHATGNWMFWPGEITVHLHDTMNLSNLSKEDVPRFATAFTHSSVRPWMHFWMKLQIRTRKLQKKRLQLSLIPGSVRPAWFPARYKHL